MRLLNRNDTFLAAGLIVGILIVFQQPLRSLLDVAQDVEGRYHVELVPALAVLSAVFVFHQYRKRQQASADATTAAAEAAQARARSEELERLVTFGWALANSLDLWALQQVLWQHLPKFTGAREIWLVMLQAGRWEILLQDPTARAHKSAEELETLAAQAISQEAREDAHAEDVSVGEFMCVPMVVAGTPVGVMGIRAVPALAQGERKALGAACALIAIAVRNLQLFLQSRDNSLRDSLTGCFNRAHAVETLDAELRRAARTKRPLSVVMFDIDHFKSINDQCGHLCGDNLLMAVGRHLNQVLRTTDVTCRHGGDEFLVILPDTPLRGAEHVAQCLREEIAKIVLPVGDRMPPITASLGVALATTGESDVTAFLKRADEALYRAKRSGRNQCCVAPSPSAAVPADISISWPRAV